jgi:hypothetical protein
VIALPAGDEAGALRLANLEKILPGHFEGGLHPLGATTHEVGVAHASRRAGNQVRRQFLGHVGGEETGVRKGQPVDLFMHGGKYRGVAMPQAGHRGTARRVKVLTAFAVNQPGTVPRHRDRRTMMQMSMKYVGGLHG